MSHNRILTLLSDFGLSDVYIGVMKGVIAQVNPQLTVVDLTHQLPPQNVAAGRFSLMNAWSYFPNETVHVAVVDPGVGSHRRAIAVEFAGGFLVGPDNGLFSGVLDQQPARRAVELSNSQYWRTPATSHTFHGRDIFAPVGAHLASGAAFENLGPEIDPATLVQLAVPGVIQTESEITGVVQYVDQFGNLITNIPGRAVAGKGWAVRVHNLTIPSYETYSDSAPSQPLALIGSHDWVELAVNGGDAHFQLRLGWGDSVQVILNPGGNQ